MFTLYIIELGKIAVFVCVCVCVLSAVGGFQVSEVRVRMRVCASCAHKCVTVIVNICY